ncbi:MAG: transposase [Gammaproteobacteria bacterium]
MRKKPFDLGDGAGLGTRACMGAPRDQRRKSVACFGAVSLRSGTLVTEIVSPFDAVTFGNFLTELLKHRAKGKRMVIIMDNAKHRHAKLLAPLLHKRRNVLTLLFLPPYSRNSTRSSGSGN